MLLHSYQFSEARVFPQGDDLDEDRATRHGEDRKEAQEEQIGGSLIAYFY